MSISNSRLSAQGTSPLNYQTGKPIKHSLDITIINLQTNSSETESAHRPTGPPSSTSPPPPLASISPKPHNLSSTLPDSDVQSYVVKWAGRPSRLDIFRRMACRMSAPGRPNAEGRYSGVRSHRSALKVQPCSLMGAALKTGLLFCTPAPCVSVVPSPAPSYVGPGTPVSSLCGGHGRLLTGREFYCNTGSVGRHHCESRPRCAVRIHR